MLTGHVGIWAAASGPDEASAAWPLSTSPRRTPFFPNAPRCRCEHCALIVRANGDCQCRPWIKSIVWIVVGLIGGSLAGLIVKRDREGFGVIAQSGAGPRRRLGRRPAVRLLRLWPGLDQIAISLRDVVAAFVGSMLVLVGLWAWQR